MAGSPPGPASLPLRARPPASPGSLAITAPAQHFRGALLPAGLCPRSGTRASLASEEPSWSVWQAGWAACLPRPTAVLCCLIRSLRLLTPVQVQRPSPRQEPGNRLQPEQSVSLHPSCCSPLLLQGQHRCGMGAPTPSPDPVLPRSWPPPGGAVESPRLWKGLEQQAGS